MQLTESQQKSLGSIVRWALMLVAVPLINHKIVNAQIAGMAIDDSIQEIVGWLVAAGALVWSQLQKIASTRRESVAAALHPPAPPELVTAMVKALPPDAPVPAVIQNPPLPPEPSVKPTNTESKS